MVTQISTSRLTALNCVLGIDVSKYQNDVNWDTVKDAGVEFAIVKFTEGNTYFDGTAYNLNARILEAKKNNVKVGYYHFARPGNFASPQDDAKQEVKNITDHLSNFPKPDFPIILDLEAFSNQMLWDKSTSTQQNLNSFIQTFINELKNTQLDVIFYSYKAFFDDNLLDNHTFGSYPLWIAQYLNNPESSLPKLPKGWNDWTIWQFTEKGKINGIETDVDLNIMRKAYFDQFIVNI
jgi:GH25 family lysozyme M1 (1,4-beta-N-acetylmuramidase)